MAGGKPSHHGSKSLNRCRSQNFSSFPRKREPSEPAKTLGSGSSLRFGRNDENSCAQIYPAHGPCSETVRPVPALSVDPVSVTFPVFETVPLVETSVGVFRARIA